MAFRHCLDQYNTINHLYMLAQEPSQIVLESRFIASPITFEFAYLVMGRMQANSMEYRPRLSVRRLRLCSICVAEEAVPWRGCRVIVRV